jgi:transposase
MSSSLEKHIPADHLLRSIATFIEVDDLRRELAAFYSNIGRPSVHSELMITMLLIGYCFGIRSERGVSVQRSTSTLLTIHTRRRAPAALGLRSAHERLPGRRKIASE